MARLFEIEAVEGERHLRLQAGSVPAWIHGQYYVNGPGRFGRGGRNYRHWLDGDGLVTRVGFSEGQVECTSRFVRSKKWCDEEEASEALYRTFGTAWDGDRLRRGIALEGPANVSAWRWQDALLAFGEQGLPYELDPRSLETRGEYTFGGRLSAVSPLSAHPHFDRATGEQFNFGISFAKRNPSFTLYRFLADGQLAYRKRLPIPFPASVHDFMLAPRHVLFYVSPHILDVDALMKRNGSVMDGLTWCPQERSRLIVAARETGEWLAEIELTPKHLNGQEARYCLHLINAWEEEDQLHLDLIELDRPVYEQYQPLHELFTDDPQGRAKRYTLTPSSWDIVEIREHGFEASMDFPSLDPNHDQMSYDDLWLLSMSQSGRPGPKFFDQLTRIRWSTDEALSWRAPEGTYLGGEPVYVAHPVDESRGCIFTQFFDASSEQGGFLLFDARDVESGPIAHLTLDHPIPLGFHASFELRE
ncbi:MAG: carotenoid oxygenase family protein [Thermoanaerobaculia bacterium]|nr:carotenoid oxygenase family protein [Thermoanaerobaculia bacterium]